MSVVAPLEAPSSGSRPAPRPCVLVVDDHADIREPLAAYLERCGFDVVTAAHATEMRALLAARSIDLVVMDIMLPGEDGLSLCRYVTLNHGTPLIFLTAMAAPHQRVAGLEVGADDYMVKPFDPPELVARIRSVLRRQARSEARGTLRWNFEGWVLDATRRELSDPAGRPVQLSEAEFQLLGVLVANPNTVLSRERLLDLTERGAEQVFDRSIDTQISRLRRKLEADPRRPTLIKTAWGNGYLFAATVRALSLA